MIENWIENNKLDAYCDKNIVQVNGVGTFYLITDENVFDENFRLNVEEDLQVDYYVFKFGSKYYHTPIGTENKPKLNLFKYIGKCKQEIDYNFPYLGIHTGYELLNGSNLYTEWIKKAKFYGYTVLGICERNTLAGVLSFQLECKKNNIKSIIGEEITVKRDDNRFDVKVYVVNETGWNNLLTIHKAIRVDNEEYVEENQLISNSEGLVLVLNPDFLLTYEIVKRYKKAKFHGIYYQIDTVEWFDNKRDLIYLRSIKSYLDYYKDQIPPILINDSYYLDKEDSHIKRLLNTIANRNIQYKSDDQYFKNLDDNYLAFYNLFNDEDDWNDLFFKCLDNLNVLVDSIDFKIDTGNLHLPKFQHNLKIDNENLFWNLIEEGVKNKLIPIFGDNIPDEYIDRISMEFEVIKKYDLIDYFLILWDIVNWCHENNIYVGLGRGSASGSIIVYLINITKIDPIKYNLLFQRFINEGRLVGSLPDIDVDFEQGRRDDVKNYIKSKYGEDYFCSVSTYTTFQIKAGIQDLGRISGISAFERDFITKRIEIGEGEDSDWGKVFDNTVNDKHVKNFVIKNTELIEDLQLCLAQPRNASVHASATIIVPKEKDIYHWIPLRKEGDVLISEWEGEYLEKAGFLKEDLLGLQQLDKFRFMTQLIKEHYNEDIDIYNLPLDDSKVFELFSNGYNIDTFQFGTLGFIDYSKLLKPENIHDLIAMVALFRPGVMGTGAHFDYVNLKHGKSEVQYDSLCEEITKNTYGIIVYQEQLMQICQVVGGFDLIDSDNIRKSTGKKDSNLLNSYKPKFIEGAIKNGYNEEGANKLWHKLEYSGQYLFNLSHATTYAITGYISMWFKANYPLEFWTTSLEFIKKMKYVSRFISEMNKVSDVSIAPPDINYSDRHFVGDPDTKKIYWSLIQIKEVGEVATEFILKDREENGKYYSLEEFIKRVSKKQVNKKVIEALIFSGSFDQIENIDLPIHRKRLLEKYYEVGMVKIKNEEKNVLLNIDINKKYWWILKQKEVSGLGYMDYYGIIKEYSSFNIGNYIDNVDFFLELKGVLSMKMVAGIVINIIEKKTKSGKEFAELELDSNDELINCVIWNNEWVKFKDILKKSIGKILIIIGEVGYNDWKKVNNLYSKDYTEIEILD